MWYDVCTRDTHTHTHKAKERNYLMVLMIVFPIFLPIFWFKQSKIDRNIWKMPLEINAEVSDTEKYVNMCTLRNQFTFFCSTIYCEDIDASI